MAFRIFNPFLIFIPILLCTTACNNSREKYYTLVGNMHTPYYITYQYKQSIDEEIKQLIMKCNHSINDFDPSSTVWKFNHNEKTEPDSLFLDIFKKSLALSERTTGMFDITCCPLDKFWKTRLHLNTSRAETETVDSLLRICGNDKLGLRGNQPVKNAPETSISFSDIGDGYICEALAQLFDRKGIENYLAEIGGTTTCRGSNQQKKTWKIGLAVPSGENANSTQKSEQTIYLKGKTALATSGDYRNFYIKNNKKCAYVLNPLTGQPADQDILSISVIAGDCLTANAYKKVFLILGTEQVKALKKSLPDIDYLIIYTDSTGKYRTTHSEGMEKYLSE